MQVPWMDLLAAHSSGVKCWPPVFRWVEHFYPDFELIRPQNQGEIVAFTVIRGKLLWLSHTQRKFWRSHQSWKCS